MGNKECTTKVEIRPVFYTAHRWRWHGFISSISLLILVLTIFFIGLALNSWWGPRLPNLPLTDQTKADDVYRAALHPAAYIASQRAKQQLLRLRAAAQRRAQTRQTTRPAAALNPIATQSATMHMNVFAFFVNWDDTSWTALKHNLNSIDVLVPEWRHLAAADGTVQADNADREALVEQYVRTQRPSTKIMPLINNFTGADKNWQADLLAQVLASPSARQQTIQSLWQDAQSRNWNGVTIDFENIPATAQSDFLLFLQEISQRFHTDGKQVAVTVPLADDQFDYSTIAQTVDEVIVMAYDEHWSTSAPGPIASQDWFVQSLTALQTQIPANKLIVAVGNYGYDWGQTGAAANELTFQEVLKTAQESDAVPEFVMPEGNSTFQYADETNTTHTVWYLDGVSVYNELRAMPVIPNGVALWRLGSEDPSLWNYFGHQDWLDGKHTAALGDIVYGYDIDYEGKGPVLRVSQEPQLGHRRLTVNVSGAVTAATVDTFPQAYTIERWGATNPKEVAITFDDGPDGQFTPAILKVLQHYKVPATFFVIGASADRYPQILRRIFKQGNEIGIHTYTHPNISLIPPRQLSLELSVSQRLLESVLGRRSVLFRPPYAEDIEPETPDQVRPLVAVSNLGYYTIGITIDPNDWQRPGTNAIVQSVVDQVDKAEGKVILLHDGGGDRSQTVAALPKIIEALQAKGYQFTTVSHLLGLSRDTVMPAVTGQDSWQARLDGLAFFAISGIFSITANLFLMGLILGMLRLAFLVGLAIMHKLDSRVIAGAADFRPKVSIVVPAYNEEKVIQASIRALLHIRYRPLEIIVIDDGSTDTTWQKLQIIEQEFRRQSVVTATDLQLRIQSVVNGGKAAALNTGWQMATGEIIVTVDADTHLDPDAVGHLVAHFGNPKVVAVAGNAQVGNTHHSVLARWQAIEYITSQNLDRRALSEVNAVPVVPGAIGAWRLSALRAAAGFSHDTLAEDADLTLQLLLQGGVVEYEPLALALTEAPTTVASFLQQRFRWTFGTLQVAWKYAGQIMRRGPWQLRLISLPNILIFQVFFPLISPLMDLVLLGSLVPIIWNWAQGRGWFLTLNTERILWYYLLFTLFDWLAVGLGFLLEKNKRWRLFPWVIIQRVIYRQLLYFVLIKSVLSAIRGHLVGWHKLERRGM